MKNRIKYVLVLLALMLALVGAVSAAPDMASWLCGRYQLCIVYVAPFGQVDVRCSPGTHEDTIFNPDGSVSVGCFPNLPPIIGE